MLYLVAMMVEVRGIEPLAPCVQSRCSPAELHPPVMLSVGLAHWVVNEIGLP